MSNTPMAMGVAPGFNNPGTASTVQHAKVQNIQTGVMELENQNWDGYRPGEVEFNLPIVVAFLKPWWCSLLSTH